MPRPRLIGALAVAALTIPGTAYMLSTAGPFVAAADHGQNLMTQSEVRALSYLAQDPQQGAVLSTYTLGDAVPGETGRRSYSGDYRWSQPNYAWREATARRLLNGRLDGEAARAFLNATGVRFVLATCNSAADLARTLAPILDSINRFGCATVYGIRAPTFVGQIRRADWERGARLRGQSRRRMIPPTGASTAPLR